MTRVGMIPRCRGVGTRLLAALAVALLFLGASPLWSAPAGAQADPHNAAAPIDPAHGANSLESRADFERLAVGGYVKFICRSANVSGWT